MKAGATVYQRVPLPGTVCHKNRILPSKCLQQCFIHSTASVSGIWIEDDTIQAFLVSKRCSTPSGSAFAPAVHETWVCGWRGVGARARARGTKQLERGLAAAALKKGSWRSGGMQKFSIVTE